MEKQMDTVIAFVRDCEPNGSRPGLDLYFPAELAQKLGWRHRDAVDVVLPDSTICRGTVGIKPPNPPYLHRPVQCQGQSRSMRDVLIDLGWGPGANIEFAVEGRGALRWVRTMSPGLQPMTGRRSPRQRSTAIKLQSNAVASSFPFHDPSAIGRLAQAYWSLISSADRQEEQAFEREVPAARARGGLTKELFVRVARWKSKRQTPRYLSNTEAAVEAATRTALGETTAAGAIVALTQLQGVALRTATALLHWLRPDEFPILDFRVVAALGETAPSSWDDVVFYERIARLIRDHANRVGVNLRTMDRALWAWDKQRS